METPTITVNIFGKAYTVKCPPAAAQELQQAAQLVDQKMRGLLEQSGTRDTTLAAIMSALNLAHELLIAQKQQHKTIKLMSEQINDLQQELEKLLVEE